MKKIIYGIIFTACIFLNLGSVKAATASVNVKLSSDQLLIGSNVTATVTISSTVALGGWDVTLGYDTTRLRLTSTNTGSGQHMVGYGDGVIKSKSYTFTFKTIATGTASASISSYRVIDFTNEAELATTRTSDSVKIITQAELEASYSKDNYLSALEVVGYTLTPVFNKETLTYAVTLPPETTKMVVNATKAESHATVAGTGEITVSDGDNKVEIKVTAQNGNLRTYVINAKVEEYNPIEVNIGDNTLTLVRKKASLVAPANYTETTVKINDTDIPAFTNTVTNYTLVGLKDSSGTVEYYIYDQAKASYSVYKELIFNQIKLYPLTLEAKDIPVGYNAKTIGYSDTTITGYKLNDKSKYALIYAMNVDTGYKNIYMYDSVENTVQIYNQEHIDSLITDKKEVDNYLLMSLVFSGVLSLGYIGLGAVVIAKELKKKKHPKKTIEATK